jgi:hypothetical protein
LTKKLTILFVAIVVLFSAYHLLSTPRSTASAVIDDRIEITEKAELLTNGSVSDESVDQMESIVSVDVDILKPNQTGESVQSPFRVKSGGSELLATPSEELDLLAPIEQFSDTPAVTPSVVGVVVHIGDSVVEVPNSYPITDAERYFVPEEQRRTGNLGGPPPLSFPGGPNDPNEQSADIGLPPLPDQ